MRQADIEKGRSLVAVLSAEQRDVDEWNAVTSYADYTRAVCSRNIAAERLAEWVTAHGDELLAIALGTDDEVERVARAIRTAHDANGPCDPYECCVECQIFARAAIDALRSGE